MAVEFTDIMVDIETTGTMPDRHSILQVSAVKFNLEAKTVCPVFYDRCLTMPTHRSWSQDTLAWWGKQKPTVLKGILSRQEPYRDVILDFAKWCYQPEQGLRFWAKPTTFDFMFLASYFADEGLPNPFHYRDATDMNSYLKGLHFPEAVPNLPWQNVGDAHNALADTLTQLKMLFAHVEHRKNRDAVQSQE